MVVVWYCGIVSYTVVEKRDVGLCGVVLSTLVWLSCVVLCRWYSMVSRV